MVNKYEQNPPPLPLLYPPPPFPPSPPTPILYKPPKNHNSGLSTRDGSGC